MISEVHEMIPDVSKLLVHEIVKESFFFFFFFFQALNFV